MAGAQTASNLATAQAQSALNNTNIFGPNGSVTYTQPGGADTAYTQTTTLSPAEQQIFNQSTQAQGTALGIANNQLGNVSNALNTPVTAPSMQTGVTNGSIANGYNPGGAIQAQVGNQDINQSVSNAELANFMGQYSLLQPQMAQASEQQSASLAAQGLNPNSAAFQNSQTLFNNGQAQELGQVASGAVAAGNNEQNVLNNQQLSAGQFANAAQAQQNTENQGQAAFANTAQQQGNSQALANASLNNAGLQADFQNQSYAQELPINEFNSLMSSGQVTQPTSTPAQTAVAPTDVEGAYALQQQALQQDYQSQMAQYNSGLGGLFNLGSSALGMIPMIPGI